ncbi:hypothetical protein [Velocimicrobium porci]|uniref:Lipoprotein n=1 Tax=Velocimicrobium porci TaxID=2606634 RepID=A0A6L5XVI8_9FIRM|nr:hypothetical protein [Velocimicrobium porci]MSS62371.1 hypothetical protein [Velocimicrobium porci]
MKTKKMIMLIATMILGIVFLTGCGDPVADEFEKFLNEDMVKINANYEDLKTEMTKWENLKDNKELEASLNDTILPNINESLSMLSKIEVETDEVKAIKAKYQKVLDTYKEGFELLLSACETDDEATIEKAKKKVDDAISLLDDYNKALEKLAKEKDMKIEY